METKIPLKQITPTPPSQTETTASLDSLSNRLSSAENNFSNYLPLSGGTITGTIESTNSFFGKMSTDTSELVLFGGNAVDTSNPVISLRGKSRSTEPGTVYIRSCTTTSDPKILFLSPNGEMSWGNSSTDNIVTSGFYKCKSPVLTKGTAPSSTTYGGLYTLCDKNGTVYGSNAIGLVETSVDTSNLVSTYIRALKNEANSTVNCQIACHVDASGNAYTSAPTPSTSDNSTKIATTAYVKSNLSSYVDLSSTQTISGSKTFTNALTVKTTGSYAGSEVSISNSDIVKGTAPSSVKYANIGFYGNAVSSYSDRIGLVECQYNSDKSIKVGIHAYNSTSSGNTNVCTISCNFDSSGNAYTFAPTPATSDNSTKIVTTAFVKNQGYITGNGRATNINVYKNLGDNYVMNVSDFDKVGAIYCINSLSTANSKNYPPSGYNTGDLFLFRMYGYDGPHAFVTLLGVTPRSTALFRCYFWNSEFMGWQVYSPTAVSS